MIMLAFFRNQVRFWAGGKTKEEKLGFAFELRCQTIMNGIDPTQKELVALLMDESLPLQKRLIAIVSRLNTLYEEIKGTATEQELETYKLLLEFAYLDLTEMRSMLGDFVPEAND